MLATQGHRPIPKEFAPEASPWSGSAFASGEQNPRHVTLDAEAHVTGYTLTLGYAFGIGHLYCWRSEITECGT
jgi:hypothetical protein